VAELYFGFAIDSGTASAGSTSGVTYRVDNLGDGVAWAANVTGALAPVWADSGQLTGVMALILEVPPSGPGHGADLGHAAEASSVASSSPPSVRGHFGAAAMLSRRR